MRVALIANGARVRGALGARIEGALASVAPGATARRTTRPGQTVALVREALAAGATRILVAGGDGTVHETVNALYGTDAELAVVPAGSGNDYARSLGVPAGIEASVEFAVRGPALQTDAGEVVCVTATGAEVRRVFVNIAEAGFGANVVRYAGFTLRFAPPWLAYQLGILASLATLRRAPVTLSADGETPGTFASSNLIVGLGQYFGSGMRPLPDALLDDGQFDIAHIRDCSRFEIARHAPVLRNGIPRDHPKIDQRRCRTLRADSAQAVPVEADGEWLGYLPASFTVRPRSLQVVRRK